MALTKASRSMLNTGISDSSDATALTFSSAEDATFAGHVSLADSKELRLGGGDDLKLYHNGSNSYIKDVGTGNLYIAGSGNITFTNGDVDETYAIFNDDGAVVLKYNDSTKLSTANDGIDVTGKIDCTTFESSGVATIGGNLTVTGNLQVDGTTTTINSTTYTVDDKNITLASGAGSSSAADGAGITIDGASATFNYVHSNTSWTSSQRIIAPFFTGTANSGSDFYSLGTTRSGSGTTTPDIYGNNTLVLGYNASNKSVSFNSTGADFAGTIASGAVTITGGNGDQLLLNNAGERFTQITLQENGTTRGALWVDGTDNYVDLYANTSHGIRLKTGGDNTRLSIDSSGNATFAAHLIVDGNTTLGNADTDTVTIPGPLAVDTDTLYVDVTNDRVGINKGTSPTQALDVVGNIVASGTVTTSAITTEGLNSTSGTVQYTDGSSSFDSSNANGYPVFTHSNGSAQIGFARGTSSTGLGYIGADSTNVFAIWDSSFATKMRVTQGGYVGMGNNIAPVSPLDVKADAGSSNSTVRFRNTNTTMRNTRIQLEDYSGALADGLLSFVFPTSGSKTGSYLGLTYNSAGLFIADGGNVGIGITNPTQKLTLQETHANGAVKDTLRITTTGTYSSSNSEEAGAAISFGQFHNNYPTWQTGLITGIRDGNNWNGSLAFYTNTGSSETSITEKMRITGAGNVGIGTTTPQYLLDVSNDANNSLQASFGRTIPSGNWAGIHFGYKEAGNTNYRKSALVFERVDGSYDGFTGAARSNNAGGRIHMLLANYGSSTASNLSQFSEDSLDGHVVSTYHVEDGSFENIHSAEWTHATTATEANYQRQRQSLTETIYDSQYIDLNTAAYSNGNWYVLCGVRSGTEDRSVTFKVDLAQASYIFFEAKASNSADSTSRTHTMEYSFDNVTYTQLQTTAWTTGQTTNRDTVYFNTTSQSNYTGQIYLRAKITGATTSHNTLVGWQGFKIKAMAQSMSFNTNKTFRGASRYIGQFCTDATQNAAIVSANSGSIKFASHMDGDMDTDIMERRTSGNYGVQFKKSGWVKLDFHQDIMTSGSTSYLHVYVYRGTASAVDGNTASVVGEFLLTNTNGQWDTINGGCFTKVNTNDVIQCKITAGGISAMDSTSWSHWMFDWFEQRTL